MNDQDRDLILALAAGQLSEADAAAASARIAADPELAQAFADQELALASLSTVPEVALTSAERQEMRSSLIAQLNLETAPAAAAATSTGASSRALRWWQPVVGLAAAAAVVTAVVVLPNQGGDDMSNVAALQPATDTAATEEETFSEDGGGELNATGSADATTTTPAAGEVTTTAPASDVASEAPEATADAEAEEQDTGTDEGAVPESQVRSADVLSATEGDDTPEEAEAGVRSSGFALDPLDTARSSEVDSCLEQLSTQLPQGDVIPLGTQVSEGAESLFIGITDAAGIAAVAAIDLDACQILEIAQR